MKIYNSPLFLVLTGFLIFCTPAHPGTMTLLQESYGFSNFNNGTNYHIEVKHAGIVDGSPEAERIATGTELGRVGAYDINKIGGDRQTDTIPGVLGTQFGIFYILQGENSLGDAPFMFRVTHPSILNPRTGVTTTVDEWRIQPTVGQVTYDGWEFEYPWEIIPGQWLFEVFHKGKVLGGMEFTVIPSKQTGHLRLKYACLSEKMENLTAIAVNDKFPVSVKQLFCFTEIIGAKEPVTINHVWFYEGTEQANVPLEVKALAWRTYSSKIIQPHQVGKWRVEILGPYGKKLGTLRFDIEKDTTESVKK